MQWIIEHFSDYNGFQYLYQYLKSINSDVQFIDVTKDQSLKKTKSDIIFFGSIDLAKSLYEQGHTNIFLGNDKFFASHLQNCSQALNRGTLINLNELFTEKEEILKTHSSIFVRPNSWEKFFSGQVLHHDTLTKDWANLVFYLNDLNIDAIYSPIKNIEHEYRLHYINHSVVTGSEYKNNEGVKQIDISIFKDFIESIKDFIPDSSCTIDVAQTKDGFKLIEFNPLSTSAIYLSDPKKIVDALLLSNN